MRSLFFLIVLLAVCDAWADPPSSKPNNAAPTGQIVANLGKREVILESGRYGLKYFPDECLAFVQTMPQVRLLMAAEVSTSFLQGKDIHSLVSLGEVLKPGKPKSFDNGYAGIGGVARAPGSGDLLAFYHAEDHEGLPEIPGGIPGFYCCVALAVSKDNGASFRKLGPVVSGSRPKDLKGRADQGCGELCVVAESSQQYLYMYYSDHSRVNNRGVQICLARCPVEGIATTNHWKKYHDGQFEEPGLGGWDTPVMSAQAMQADAIFPQVTFVPQLRRYIMVFNIIIYRELGLETRPEQTGMHMACSQDGIHWSKATQLLAIRSLPAIGKELGWHPVLVLSKVEGNTAKGWLYYSYSERWGHKAPQKPHYLVGQPITFSIVEK